MIRPFTSPSQILPQHNRERRGSVGHLVTICSALQKQQGLFRLGLRRVLLLLLFMLNPNHSPAAAMEPDWATGDGVSVGEILFPHFHAHGVYGGSSGDEGSLAVAHHDPASEGFTLNLEGGFSLRAGEHFEGFTTSAFRWDDAEQTWEQEFEEWFLKWKDLPGGIDLRAGQYLNRFGLQNTFHNHGWDFVDQNLVSGRFMGDDGMATQGGEVTWKLPFLETMTFSSLLSVSVGNAVTHEEEGHDAEEGESPRFDAAGAAFDGTLVTVNWTNLYRRNDFHTLRAGASFALGENAWGRQTSIFGAHTEYQWRANGLEKGGHYFRWRTEAVLRSLQAVEAESSRKASLSEWGISSALVYGLATANAGTFEPGVRLDYVQGIEAAALDERWRLSPALTWYPTESRTLSLRLQYNLDHTSSEGTAHGIWAQIGINWGGGEVR